MDLSTKEWNQIRDSIRRELALYEREKFGTKNRLFYSCRKDPKGTKQKSDARQKDYENKWQLAQKLRRKYLKLSAEINAMVKLGTPIAEFAEKFKLSENIIKTRLYSSATGNPTPSQLVLKILEDSPEAKELGIRNGGRLYDEIISRKQFKEFPKGKKYTSGQRIGELPK